MPSWWSVLNQSTSALQTISLDPEVSMKKPISVKFKTALGNTFEKTFFPPNPIINIEYQSYQDGTGATVNREVLDGSQSDHPGDGYIVEWNWHISTEPYLFRDLDDDRVYTAQPDTLVVSETYPIFDEGDRSFNNSAAGEELTPFDRDDNVFADDRFNPNVVWIENGSNDWYNETLDEDVLLLNITGGSVDNNTDTSNTSGTNVWEWDDWFYYDKNESGNFSFNRTHCEDILIDYHDGGTYSNQSDSIFGCLFSQEAISLDGRQVNAEFDYEDGREHYITLTVVDNYGMESVTTMVYRH
jgi:hypothetical protein